MAQLQAVEPHLSLRQIVVCLVESPPLSQRVGGAVGGELACEQVHHEVGVEDKVRLLSVDGARGRVVIQVVDQLHLGDRILPDDVLQHRRQGRELPQRDTVVSEALLNTVEEVGRHPLIQGHVLCTGHHSPPDVAAGGEAADVPPMALHEEPVERVEHRLVSQPAVRVLRQRLVGLAQGGLQFDDPASRRACGKRNVLGKYGVCIGSLHRG
mmetsp:Transcript_70697/g.199615  ORF Transcript_70697/g.199615 Transcript_70697/m.199615 type:complete len:211 (+) Transcript_70697:1242-1874(+)